jgi:hypothetical protein
LPSIDPADVPDDLDDGKMPQELLDKFADIGNRLIEPEFSIVKPEDTADAVTALNGGDLSGELKKKLRYHGMNIDANGSNYTVVTITAGKEWRITTFVDGASGTFSGKGGVFTVKFEHEYVAEERAEKDVLNVYNFSDKTFLVNTVSAGR